MALNVYFNVDLEIKNHIIVIYIDNANTFVSLQI